MNDQEVKDLIDKNVKLYNHTLNRVAEKVPKSITRQAQHSEGEIVIMSLTDSDRKDIATSIFIETNRQLNAEKSAKEPATDSQKTFIADLISQKGEKGHAFMQKYLDDHDLETGEQLTKEQASEIITTLKAM